MDTTEGFTFVTTSDTDGRSDPPVVGVVVGSVSVEQASPAMSSNPVTRMRIPNGL